MTTETTLEMVDSEDKRLNGEPERKGVSDNNAISPNPQTTEPKFKKGSIVRSISSHHSTRMEITDVMANHAGPRVHRYYGKYKVPKDGGSWGRYEDELMEIKK